MSSGSNVPCFIDSNIWLYAFILSQDINKSTVSKGIIQNHEIIISSQVINEVCVNLIKKAHFHEAGIRDLIESFYNRYRVVVVDKDVLLKSSEVRERLRLSYWDSIIVSSALIGGADVLYTEDLSHGLLVENRLEVINPFAL